MPGAGGVRVGGKGPGGPRGSSFILFALNRLWCERDVGLPSALQESSGKLPGSGFLTIQLCFWIPPRLRQGDPGSLKFQVQAFPGCSPGGLQQDGAGGQRPAES